MRFLKFIGFFFLLIASPAMAKESSAAWRLAQKSGSVQVIRSGLQPASVQVNAALSAGDTIVTGADGRAMLTRGGDYVVVAPGSRLLLPAEDRRSGFTRLIQQVGTMLYKVRHTGVPHFAVETPMLAAVVKGTSFTVIVDQSRTAVQVTEGLVEVSAALGDSRRLVEGGRTVYIGRERPTEIVEVTSLADLPQSGKDGVKVEESGDVPLSSVTDLTGGLVREGVVAPVANPVTTTVPVLAVSAPLPGLSPTPTSPVPGVIDPIIDVVDAVAPGTTDPIVDIVDTVLPGVTDPVVDIVDSLPGVTDPVIDIVDSLPGVTDPIVDIVDSLAPDITEPVIDIVETVLPEITEPVVDIVDTVVPEITEPVVAVVPVITEPIVDVVESVVPPVTLPLPLGL